MLNHQQSLWFSLLFFTAAKASIEVLFNTPVDVFVSNLLYLSDMNLLNSLLAISGITLSL